VVTNLDGEFICQVGSSEEGLLDGQFDTASFNRPQVRDITMLSPCNNILLLQQHAEYGIAGTTALLMI
jgi:hypothetical protein